MKSEPYAANAAEILTKGKRLLPSCQGRAGVAFQCLTAGKVASVENWPSPKKFLLYKM